MWVTSFNVFRVFSSDGLSCARTVMSSTKTYSQASGHLSSVSLRKISKTETVSPSLWHQQVLPVRPPIFTYLGHVLAHPTQEETAWDMVTSQLHHDLAAYWTLPLNGHEKVTIINFVLIPRWTYRAFFLGNRQRMAQWDDMLLQYQRDTPGIEKCRNRYQLTTDTSNGGLGLRQLWWSYVTRLITLGQSNNQQCTRLPHNTNTLTRSEP